MRLLKQEIVAAIAFQDAGDVGACFRVIHQGQVVLFSGDSGSRGRSDLLRRDCGV